MRRIPYLVVGTCVGAIVGAVMIKDPIIWAGRADDIRRQEMGHLYMIVGYSIAGLVAGIVVDAIRNCRKRTRL